MSEVTIVLADIKNLLNSSGESQWAATFDYFLKKIQGQSIDAVKREILTIYNGMGSFNDLVLYDNGQILRFESTKLNELRQQLFTLLTQ